MKAAIYARRSTEEHQAASIDVQLEASKEYAAKKGWTVEPQHIYIDDAISRAEFKKRPGLLALLNAAQDHEFDVIITRDETRLGGDTNRTCLLIQNILDAGVGLYYYFSDERVQLDSPLAKVMVSLRSFVSEMERVKISQRTHEHLKTKARKGFNTGGRVYGYSNVEVKNGETRIHVEYAIDPEQAEIVAWCFQKHTEGWGLKRLVKDLNGRRVPPPRAGKRGTGSWSTSALREMLRNPRYRGLLVWGQFEKTYKGGTKVRIPRPESEWVIVEKPELRIVSDEVWFAVQAKRPGKYGRKPGRPTRYLLSGIGKCSQCGGPMQVINGKQGKSPIKAYACSYYRQRGVEVCTNKLRRPVDQANEMVTSWVREKVLREAVVLEVLEEVRRRLRLRGQQEVAAVPDHEAEVRRLKTEIDNLVTAVAAGGSHTGPLFKGIADRQERAAELEAKLKAIHAVPVAIETELGRVEDAVRARLDDLRGLLDRNQEEAKKVLDTLFEGRITFTPMELPDGSQRYWLEGRAVVGHLFVQESTGVTKGASPAGFEPALQP